MSVTLSKPVVIIVAIVVIGGVITASFIATQYFSNNNTSTTATTTTTPFFPPPSTSTSSSATSSSTVSNSTSSSTFQSTSSTSSTTSTVSTTTSTITLALIPTSLSVTCQQAANAFFTCNAILTSPADLQSGNETLTWTINQGGLSPFECTLVGSTTVEQCGGILAGGQYQNSYTVTATYAGDYSHAPSKGTLAFSTGIAPLYNQMVVVSEFPLGSATMIIVVLVALAAFGFVGAKRRSSGK